MGTTSRCTPPGSSPTAGSEKALWRRHDVVATVAIEVAQRELGARNGKLDDSRFDLNGDGFTGGTQAARFDLEIDDPPAAPSRSSPLTSATSVRSRR